MTLLFDTLKIAKSLQPAFTAEQAESLARALQDNASSDVATKTDISELGTSTKADISELRAEMRELRASTKADVVELRAEISDFKASTKAEFVELRTEITEFKASIKTEIAELRIDMVQQISLLRADTVKWIVSAMVFNVVAMTGLVITLIKVFGKP